MPQADLIWMNGELVAFEDAKVHVLTHALHYGTGVFEGIRAYETPERRVAIFRHADHIDRLFRSAGMYFMDIPYTREEIRAAMHETIRRNGLKSCYIRPLVFRGAGPMGLYPLDCPVEVTIAVWQWGAYLGDEGKQHGVRAQASPRGARLSHDSLIPAAKASGQYLNSVLAKIEADKAGYEEGILLDQSGNVCEGTGENIFVVKDGAIATPPFTSAILGGINRASVIADRPRSRLRGRRARDRPRRALPGRRDLHDRHGGRADAGARDRRPAGRQRRARRGHARGPARVRGRAARPLRALRRVARRGSERSARRDDVTAIVVYDTTLRDGRQGEGMSLSAEDKLRVTHLLDDLGVRLHRGRLPGCRTRRTSSYFQRWRSELPLRTPTSRRSA